MPRRGFEAGNPGAEECVDVWQHAAERLLHRANRLDEKAEAVNRLNRGKDGVGSRRSGRLEEDGHKIPGDTVMEIDGENLFDHLVLTQIDLRFSDRTEERLEDRARRRVLASERCCHASTKVIIHLRRFRIPNASRCGAEIDDFADELRRGRGRSVTSARGAKEKRVLD